MNLARGVGENGRRPAHWSPRSQDSWMKVGFALSFSKPFSKPFDLSTLTYSYPVSHSTDTMPFKFKTACAVCAIIIDQGGYKKAKLAKEIDSYLLGDTHMVDIVSKYKQDGAGFSRNSLSNHLRKRHQWLDLSEGKNQETVARIWANHKEFRRELLAQGFELLKENKLPGVTVNSVLKATDQELRVEEKSKDRSLDILKLMTQSRAGNTQLPPGTEPFDPWEGTEQAPWSQLEADANPGD